MAVKFPSRAWSCSTLQRGLSLVPTIPMSVAAPHEPDVAAMQRELEQLKAEREADEIRAAQAAVVPKGPHDTLPPGVVEVVDSQPATPDGRKLHDGDQGDDQDFPATQPDSPQGKLLTFQEWRELQDRYVETPLTAVASPPGLPETPAEQQVETHSLESGADKADGHVPTPAQKPGVALSKDAIDKRLRRVFQPRAYGTYLVSEDFVKKCTARGEDREKLLIMFEKCDYAPDKFVRRCKKITQEIDETELDIGYSFMTVEDMENEGYPQWKIDGVIAYCENDPSLQRTSKYGGGTMYWVENAITGHKRNIKRNTLERMMEWEEDGEVQDLDLTLPGRQALGNAFGHQDAGNAPGPGPSEGEFAKALRQAGFPEVESKAAPQTIVNKVLTGIQKRVLKMQEFLDKFKGCQDMPLVAKMVEKIQGLKGSLEEQGEKLSELHGTGIIDGFGQELQQSMNDAIRQARKVAGEALMLEPRARALLNDVQRKRRSELPGNSSKRPKPGLTPQGKARAPKAAPKQVAKAKAKAKGAAAPK